MAMKENSQDPGGNGPVPGPSDGSQNASVELQNADNSHYREIFNSTNDAILIHDTAARGILDVNKAMLNMYGYANKEEVLRLSISDLSAEPGRNKESEIRRHLDIVLKKGSRVFEGRAKRKNGQVFWVKVHLKRIRLGGSDRILAVVRDITREKESQKALRERESLYRGLFEGANDAILLMENGRFIDCNHKAENLYKTSRDQILDRRPEDFSPPVQADGTPSAEAAQQHIRATRKGRPQLFEWLHQSADGSILHTEVSLSLVQTGDKQVLQAIVRDISRHLHDVKIQKVLYGITNAVVFSDNLESLIRQIREQLESLFAAPNFYIALYDEESGMLSIPYELDEMDSIQTWPAERSATGLVIEGGKSLLLKRKDVERLLEEDVIDLIGTPSEVWLGVPLFDSGKVIGAIAMQSYTDPNAFNTHTVSMLEFVSSQIGLAIQRKKAITDLIAAKEKAEENNRLKTAFLNNLSHEIRTPLNAIVGFSEFLNEPGLDPARIHNLTDIICRSSNQLLSIIEDIVNISKIEAGLIEAWERETDVNRIIANVYDQLQIKAAQKEIKFRYNSSLHASESLVVTDETKLTQVLSNLVDNAIKFTDKGHVEYGCSLKQGFLKFYVADSGLGIDPKMIEIIFERFHQLETDHAQTKGGMGLGLPISKSFVELLGGEIWVESKPGSGSIFFFTIPWKPFSPQHKEKKAPAGHDEIKEKQTILVAEDEENNFELTKVILSMYDVEILHAWDGKQAVDYVTGNREIDLVLMDIKMPVMNGYDATRAIKKLRPDLPVIALTAYALPGDREKALSSGCDDYMSKPVSLKEFLSIVKKHL